MKLLVFVLNVPEKLEDVLAAYVECGVNGATVIDSVGMGHFLARTMPIFAGFHDHLRAARTHNKTIVSVIENDETVPRLAGLLEGICGPFDGNGSGILFTVPVENVRGLRPESG